MKGKVYKMVVRPAMMYGIEMAKRRGGAGGGRDKDAQVSLDVIRSDSIRYEYIRGTAAVEQFF